MLSRCVLARGARSATSWSGALAVILGKPEASEKLFALVASQVQDMLSYPESVPAEDVAAAGCTCSRSRKFSSRSRSLSSIAASRDWIASSRSRVVCTKSSFRRITSSSSSLVYCSFRSRCVLGDMSSRRFFRCTVCITFAPVDYAPISHSGQVWNHAWGLVSFFFAALWEVRRKTAWLCHVRWHLCVVSLMRSRTLAIMIPLGWTGKESVANAMAMAMKPCT